MTANFRQRYDEADDGLRFQDLTYEGNFVGMEPITDGIKGASDDVIAYTRQVLHTATTHEHNGVLLEIVTDTRNVCRNFHPVR